MLVLTVGLTAATVITILLEAFEQEKQVTARASDDLVVDEGAGDWCLGVYEERAKSHPIPTLSQSQIASLAKRTPLPEKVSSLQRLFQSPLGTLVVWDSTKELVFKYDFLPKPRSFTVGVVTTAIGKYIQFLEGFISSIDKYFLVGEKLTYVIFTDHVNKTEEIKSEQQKIVLREENMGWPHNALLLYHFLNKYSETLLKFDYVYVFDVDISVEAEVGLEILGRRVGTIHPGFFTKPRSAYTYDDNPKSTAYVNKMEGVYYFAGALFGGCAEEVAAMARTINRNIQEDLEIDYIAVWHDESHLNRQADT